MCGFAGFIEFAPARSHDESARLIDQMTNRLTHRGPDDHGHWLNGSGSVALGHRRLSILDTSQHGHQPMASPCGRFVLAYNGEVYNHVELRRELLQSGATFQGQSDTETLVAGFSHWGIQDTIERCIGMFALAVWDTAEQSLTLIRDRLGIKPLYYGMSNGSFLFGSELKALRVHPAFNPGTKPGSDLAVSSTLVRADSSHGLHELSQTASGQLTDIADVESAGIECRSAVPENLVGHSGYSTAIACESVFGLARCGHRAA